MRALDRFPATRVVAKPAALDAYAWPKGALVLRTAPDEVLALTAEKIAFAGDEHAIVERDDGFAGAWVPSKEALAFLESACEWEPPAARPAFAQGAVAGLPAKLFFETERVLFLVPAPYAADLQERLR